MATHDTARTQQGSRAGPYRPQPARIPARGRRGAAVLVVGALLLGGCVAAEADTPAQVAEPIPPDHLVPFLPDRPDEEAEGECHREPLLPDHLMQ